MAARATSGSSSVVHVQPVVGLAWLILNWRLAFSTFLLALLPAYWLVQRWRHAQHKSKALFDFTLAESLRKQGETKASVRKYDEILKLTCPEQLVWRCYSGRSMALLARGDAALALADATKALELAEALQAKAVTLQKAAAAAATATATATATAASSSTSTTNATASTISDPDLDPFLSLPCVSLALLLHNRGLIFESLPGPLNREQAQADFARAAELEPDLGFCVGQKARIEMERRLRKQSENKDQQEEEEQSKEGVTGTRGTTAGSKKP